MSDQTLTLLAVGGPSGVGKTTVLTGALADRQHETLILSTGTFFRDALVVTSRDDVRKSDWPEVEGPVADAMCTEILGAAPEVSLVVIDTHFAAKTARGTYRIGMLQKNIMQLADATVEAARLRGRDPRFNVVLIDADAIPLLQRRREDKSRDRELDAYDCYGSIRENRLRAPDYAMAFRSTAAGNSATTFDRIVNDDLAETVRTIKRITKSAGT